MAGRMMRQVGVAATLRPRAPVVHDRSKMVRRKKGIRGNIEMNVAKKLARLEKKRVADARAAGLEDDTLEEEEEAIMAGPVTESTKTVNVTVKMKLSSFCENPRLRKVLGDFVMDVNTLVAETYAFANFHVTRVLEAGGAVTDVGHKFYYACLSAASTCRVVDTTHSPEMKLSIAAFDELRPANVPKIETARLNAIRSELAIGMATMASNHLWMNLASRLAKYLKWKHPDVTKSMRAVVVDCVARYPTMKLSTVHRLSLKVPKGQVIGAAKKAAIDRAVDLITELRTLCPMKTTGVASNAPSLLPLYLVIMRDTERAYAESRVEPVDPQRTRFIKKARFSLLPNKNGYTISYVPFCGRALMSVLTRTVSREGAPLEKKLGPDSGHDAAWRKHFNVNMVETRNRIFGGRISTDGVSVSIAMDRVQACVLSTATGEWDPERICREKGGMQVLYGGIDPGVTDVVTVAHSTELEGLKEGPDKSVRATVSSYSSSKYAEDSRQKCSARNTSRWNLETSDLVDSIVHASDRSTSKGYGKFIGSYLAVVRPLLAHRAERGYRNMRFMRYRFKQLAVRAICDLIAPKGKYTVAGYGDWSGVGTTPIKRRWCGPQQDIKRELGRRDNVLLWSMWEFRTSVTCHRTWRRLTNMRAKTWRRDRTDGTFVLSAKRTSVHKILHCRSSEGAAKHPGGCTWNRDANASRNILMLLMLVVLGIDRPGEFKPADSSDGRGKQGKASASRPTATTLSEVPLVEGSEGSKEI